jgi:hypothetical protein
MEHAICLIAVGLLAATKIDPITIMILTAAFLAVLAAMTILSRE